MTSRTVTLAPGESMSFPFPPDTVDEVIVTAPKVGGLQTMIKVTKANVSMDETFVGERFEVRAQPGYPVKVDLKNTDMNPVTVTIASTPPRPPNRSASGFLCRIMGTLF